MGERLTLQLRLLGLLLTDALRQYVCIFIGSVFAGFCAATFQGLEVAFVLEALRSDETLNAGGLEVGFLAFAFGLDFTSDDEFADL